MFKNKKEEKLKKFIEAITDVRVDLYFVNKMYQALKFRCDALKLECYLRITETEFYFEIIQNKPEFKTAYINSTKIPIINAFDYLLTGYYKKYFDDLLKEFMKK